MKETCENTERLDVKQVLIDEIEIAGGEVRGVVAETGERYLCRAVVLASGTYLRGRVIVGDTSYDAGPNGQRASARLSASLVRAGIRLMRFKTGTPARVDARSLDYDKMEIQLGDEDAPSFSFMTEETTRLRTPCWLTYTNEATHRVIRENLHRAPMANGVIQGVGPRYCPSIETKVTRFPEKDRHQLFIEPEGLHTREMYVQGMSTSLPVDVQIAFLHTIPGLEHCRMMRAGYAIEYDCLDPLQLSPTLELKRIRGFFSAGQANGTSGYEEAAAQGLMAGVNAAMYVRGGAPLVLKRSEAYIGVLIDDLVTKGTREPYRMMTSRAEYRLMLRQDNADLRLTEYGRRAGLVTDARYARYQKKKEEIEAALSGLRRTVLTPNRETNGRLAAAGFGEIRTATTLFDFLRRPEADYARVQALFDLPRISADAARELDTVISYEGYIRRQEEQIARMERLEEKRLPDDIDYARVPSLREEAREKLAAVRPRSVGQAGRISGVSPADISVLLVWLEKEKRARRAEKAEEKEETRHGIS